MTLSVVLVTYKEASANDFIVPSLYYSGLTAADHFSTQYALSDPRRFETGMIARSNYPLAMSLRTAIPLGADILASKIENDKSLSAKERKIAKISKWILRAGMAGLTIRAVRINTKKIDE